MDVVREFEAPQARLTVKKIVTHPIAVGLGMVLLGIFGAWLYWTGSSVYQDWKFLHQARINNEHATR
jgi:hypothetical protein